MKIDIEKELKDVDARVERAVSSANKMRQVIPLIAEALEKSTFCYFYAEPMIICGFRTREDFAPLRAMARKWEKGQPQIGRIDYASNINGIEVTVQLGELPPSCQIIEEKIEVPETVIPAHEETRCRIVCAQKKARIEEESESTMLAHNLN